MYVPLLLAFQVAAAQPTFSGILGQTDARIPKADATIVVDGTFDEPVWRTAARLTGFSLYSPTDGRPAPDSTEVLLWYSSTALHIGIRAFEPHGIVRATLADRDRISADDNVEIHLDTFGERRRAFVFIVNPLGVQADGTKSEGGGFIPGSNIAPGQNDLSADFIWQSKGHLTDGGYEVELRIPFSSLRYPIGGAQRWGFQVDRRVQHSGYEETWTPARRASASFISQEGTIASLEEMQHGQVIQLNPELTNTVNGAPNGAAWRYTSKPQLGGNVRWGIGSNFVLNGTIKPDFSQVESDATQIAADQRFALFYAERRPFFVEGSDQFNVPNTLVYTRRIVRPDAAAKLTGKIGRTDLAVLSALDDGTTTPNGERPLVDIVRLQRAFGSQNTAGLLYSDRVGGGREHRLVGADTRIVFGGVYYAQFQGAVSDTRTGGLASSGPMWEAVVDRTGRNFGFHYNILGIAPQFRADNGFVNRTGIVQPSINNRFTVFGPPGNWFERYQVFVQSSAIWNYTQFFAGENVLEKRISFSNSVLMRGGWSVTLTPGFGGFRFDSAAYGGSRATSASGSTIAFVPRGTLTSQTVQISAVTPTFRRFGVSASTTFGQDVDFIEASSIRRLDMTAGVELRPTSQLRISGSYVASQFTRQRDGVRSQITRIPRAKVEYQLTRAIFVRVVSQYEATKRAALVDPQTGRTLLVASGGSFVPSTERTSNTLRVDGLFSYRPSPGRVIFFGYGNSMTEPDPLDFQRLRRVSDGFFLKLSYLIG